MPTPEPTAQFADFGIGAGEKERGCQYGGMFLRRLRLVANGTLDARRGSDGCCRVDGPSAGC